MYDNLDKENKKLNRYQKSLSLQCNLQKKEVTLIVQLYMVLMTQFNYYKQILPMQVFKAKSAVDPKFYLLFVDLFTSKIYTFPIKTRNLLAKKLEQFYNDIQKKKKKWQDNEIAN